MTWAVTSTAASIERMPERRRRSTRASGTGAAGSMPRTIRPVKRAQAELAATSSGKRSSSVGATGSIAPRASGRSFFADRSRASPRIDRQSPRSGVRSTSMIVPSRPSQAASSVPGVASSPSSMMPAPSSPSPSSTAEQSMPWESTPRSLAFFSFVPSGRRPPTRANAVARPARAFGAPQITCTGSASPASTVQTRSRSASGCRSAVRMRPTTTFSNAGRADSTPSTSSPREVSCSHSPSVSSGGSIHSRSHASSNFMRPPRSRGTARESADRSRRTA